MNLFRPRSLFWTFAGAFFVVLVVTAVLQVVMIAAVVRPINERAAAGRASLAMDEAAAEVRRAGGGLQDLIRATRSRVDREAGFWLVVVDEDEKLMGPRGRMGISLDRVLEDRRLGFGGGPGGPGGRGPGVGRRGGEPPPPPESDARPRETRRLGPRLAVALDDGFRGEVVAVLVSAPGFRLPGREFRGPLLFLPLAFLVAGGAGLVLLQLLLRRLRRLEELAARVTDGDLTARVPDPGNDEIGLLARRLNLMIETLAASRAELEAVDGQRRRLLQDISHELATPLTSIRGYAETLTNDAVPLTGEERRNYLDDLLGESERLGALVNDLLEITRLEAGTSPLRPERLDWAALCRNTAHRFQDRFGRAGVALVTENLDQPMFVTADGRRLEQVIENLLTNTLRYVPRGESVTVSLTREGSTVRLQVADTGPGIPPAEIDQVFDRFYRADPARAASREISAGTGLGLAIVREILEGHGGTVSAENRDPHGLLIRVDLPETDPAAS